MEAVAPMPDEDSRGGAPQVLIRSGSRLRLHAWQVSWRLVALIAILTLAVIGFGGARISAAGNAAVGDEHVQQLASFGNAIAGQHGLVPAMEDEVGVLAEYVAEGRPDSANDLLLPQANQAVTNLAAAQVESLTSRFGTGYPQQVQAAVTTVKEQVQEIKDLRAQALWTQAPTLDVIEAYTNSANILLSVDDQIATTSGDPQLSADVRALGALSQAENSAAEERAILNAVLTRGNWQPGEAATLSGASVQARGAITQFQADVPDSEFTSYLATVSGSPVITADGMLAEAVGDGQTGVLPSNPTGSGFSTALRTWQEDMTYEINQMRQVQQNLLNAIQARSQVLHLQATHAVTDDWIEMLAVVAAVMGLAVVAGWKSSPSRRIHWI
jgi:Nitrate and nitrite sensing